MIRRLRPWAALALVLTVAPAARAQTPDARPLWIAITAPALFETIGPLAQCRSAQGFDIQILDDAKLRTDAQRAARNVGPLRSAIRSAIDAPGSDRRREVFVVLAGFEPAAARIDAARKPFALPAGNGSAANMASVPSDAVVADLDGDDRPDVMIGRLPARDGGQLAQMIAKIVRFESQSAPAPWQHRFVLMAGAPNYGRVVDALLESMVIRGLNAMDGRWLGQVFYNNAASRLGCDQARLLPALRRALGEGAALTVYTGHSNAQGFYLGAADFAAVKTPVGGGPFVALSCYGGVQDGRTPAGGDGFAVVAMRNPDGPVATFAAAQVSHPYCNKMLLEGLAHSMLNGAAPERPLTVGRVVAHMHKALATADYSRFLWAALNQADGTDHTFDEQRRGHLQMYSLFGDPATRWPTRTTAMKLSAPTVTRAGATLRLTGELVDANLADARLVVSIRQDWTALTAGGTVGPSTEDLQVAGCEARVENGRFEVELPLPARLRPAGLEAHLVARVWAIGADGAQAVAARCIELRDTEH
ncbi:MAG TPA: C25 family cysteine peptidase [Phycisphaerae bacterium]|nr:C25 family cysteine peptidase [Phycisphaerae bacterium]